MKTRKLKPKANVVFHAAVTPIIGTSYVSPKKAHDPIVQLTINGKVSNSNSSFSKS